MAKKSIVYVETVEDSFDIIKEKFENSTRANKNFALFLLSFTTYILVTTFATKDIQLLFPEFGVHLPILNIDLNLTTFIIVAPFLLMAMYINFLLNINEHIKLLYKYEDLSYKQKNTLIHLKPIVPFMIDNAFLNPQKSSFIFRIISHVILFIYPLATLGFVYLRFTDYQSLWLSIIDFSIFGIAFISVILFFKSLIKKKIYVFKIVELPLFLFFAILIHFAFYLNFMLYDGDFVTPNLKVKSTEVLPFPKLDSYVNYLKNIKILTKSDYTIIADQYSFPKIDLSDRSLKNIYMNYAFLPYAVLTRVNLSSANLIGVNLQSSSLVNVNLSSSDLHNANLSFSNLLGANLSFAELYEVDLSSSNLVATNFFMANIWHINFMSSDLTNANLSSVYIQKSNLSYANLKGTNFKATILFDINLTNVKNYNDAIYEGTLILNPVFDKNSSEDIKDFFNSSRFKDFDAFYEYIKIQEYTTGKVFNSLSGLHMATKGTKYEKDVSLLILKLIKYWGKTKIQNLNVLLSFSDNIFNEINKAYRTEDIYLTEKEIQYINHYFGK